MLRFTQFTLRTSRMVVCAAMVCIVVTMIFSIFDLIALIFQELLLADPNLYTISIDKSLKFFSNAVTIFVGYELTKSISLMMSANKIPIADICKTATIAMMNKLITMDSHQVNSYWLISMSVVILSLVVAIYFFSKLE